MTLRELREKRSMTQMEIAVAVEVSLPTVGAWEKGTSRPRPIHVRKLATLFGVSIEEMQAVLDTTAQSASSS